MERGRRGRDETRVRRHSFLISSFPACIMSQHRLTRHNRELGRANNYSMGHGWVVRESYDVLASNGSGAGSCGNVAREVRMIREEEVSDFAEESRRGPNSVELRRNLRRNYSPHLALLPNKACGTAAPVLCLRPGRLMSRNILMTIMIHYGRSCS